jgi:hypothetical protein
MAREGFFGLGGQRKLLKRLDTDKRIQENQRKIKAFFLEKFGRAWRRLGRFGVDLEKSASTCLMLKRYVLFGAPDQRPLAAPACAGGAPGAIRLAFALL